MRSHFPPSPGGTLDFFLSNGSSITQNEPFALILTRIPSNGSSVTAKHDRSCASREILPECSLQTPKSLSHVSRHVWPILDKRRREHNLSCTVNLWIYKLSNSSSITDNPFTCASLETFPGCSLETPKSPSHVFRRVRPIPDTTNVKESTISPERSLGTPKSFSLMFRYVRPILDKANVEGRC